jgi:hypothetical protein
MFTLIKFLIQQLNKYMSNNFKSGQKVPRSGQYEIIGIRGGHTGEEITGVKGKILPPTPKPGQEYKLVDPTK